MQVSRKTFCFGLQLAVLILIPALPLLAEDFAFPSGLTLDPEGHVVVADRAAHRVFRIDPDTGAVSTIVGTGEAGLTGDGGPAAEARVKHPEWVEYDAHGNLYLADRGNHRVRRIDAKTGVITTIAGTGEFQYAGDGGPAVEADLTNPFGLLVDARGDLLVFDTEAHCIRRIDAATGIITTVVGSTQQGFGGDGGPAAEALLYRPHNGVFDKSGALVFGDSFNQRIRRWDRQSGRIETIAGRGEEGSSPDETPASEAKFMYFGAMAYDASGSLVFTSLDDRILKIDAETGQLETIAGTGEKGFGGDGGPATAALLSTPYGLTIAPNGDLFFADAGNRRVRRIEGKTGRIVTLAGSR